MALKDFANLRLGYAGTLEETVKGTFQTGSDYDRLPATEISFDPQTEQITISEIGRASPSRKRTTSTHITGSVTYPMRFADLDEQIRRGLRDSPMPTEVSVAATATLTASGASHLDGTTGAQIRVLASNGAFDALNAASSNLDLEELALWIYGSAADDWNQKGYVVAKPGNPRDDGADTVIDIRGEHQQAAGGSGFGEPWTGEVGAAVTVDAGAAVRNKVSTPGGNKTYSLLCYYPDVAKWCYATGVQFGPPSFNWGDRGVGTMTQNFIADAWGELTDTDPISGNTISDALLTWSEQIIGGVDIRNIYIGSETTGINLAGCFITGLSLNNAGDWTPVNNSLGAEGLCGTLGAMMDPSASFTYYVDDAADAVAIDRALQVIANRGTRETCYLEVFLEDLDGNQGRMMMYGEPELSTVQSVGGGSDAPASGTFSLGGFERSATSGGFIWQRRALGAAEV